MNKSTLLILMVLGIDASQLKPKRSGVPREEPIERPRLVREDSRQVYIPDYDRDHRVAIREGRRKAQRIHTRLANAGIEGTTPIESPPPQNLDLHGRTCECCRNPERLEGEIFIPWYIRIFRCCGGR